MIQEGLPRGLLLALALVGSFLSSLVARAAPWSPVPVPTQTTLDVREREIHPFPWVPLRSCQKISEPGCFNLEKVSADEVILRFTRFAVDEGKVVSARFGYRTPVTKEGSEYELYTIKLGDIRREWIYVVLEKVSRTTARLMFLKYPTFVTEKARIVVTTHLDIPSRRLRETYRIEAQDPITLIGLSRLPSAIAPFSRIQSVHVNGDKASFPYPNIMNLNLPSGISDVTVDLALGSQIRRLTLQGTLFEPRKMALIEEVDLRAILDPKLQRRASLKLTTLGVPKPAWDNFRSTLLIEPTPVSSVAPGLSVVYRLPPTREIRVKSRPRILYGKRNYPMMVTIGVQ